MEPARYLLGKWFYDRWVQPFILGKTFRNTVRNHQPPGISGFDPEFETDSLATDGEITEILREYHKRWVIETLTGPAVSPVAHLPTFDMQKMDAVAAQDGAGIDNVGAGSNGLVIEVEE